MNEEKLYHYTSIKSLSAILETKSLRFGSLLTMDDKIERIYAHLITLIFFSDTHSDEVIKKKLKNIIVDSEFITRFITEIYLDEEYCLSLSEDNNNVIMWDNYAGKDDGLCIEIDVLKLYDYLDSKIQNIDCECFASDLFLISIQKVFYGYDYETIYQIAKDILEKDMSDEVTIKQFLDYLGFILSGWNKTKNWEYQKEHRILIKEINQNRFFKFGHFLKSNGSDSIDFENKTIEDIKNKIFFGGEKVENDKKFLLADISSVLNSKLFTRIFVRDTKIKRKVKKILEENNMEDTEVVILPL